MRLGLIVVSLLCSLAFCANAEAAPPKKTKTISSRKLGLAIHVEGDNWGGARKGKIETVLYAVADELLSHVPQKLSTPIVVRHTEHNPVALYDKGADGEYVVQLHASGERWYLYAYEFAHEFCHIISNYDENLGSDRLKHNQWFEEALCETASLYTLKRLAETWEASPSPEWSRQARHLHAYYDLLVNEGHRRLPSHMPLAGWLGAQEEQLRRNPYQREWNQLVANQLLPLFEHNPESWDAVCYLNLDPNDTHNDLRQYLRNWHDHVPEQHRAFVASVVGLLAGEGVVAVASESGSVPAPVAALSRDAAGVRTR